MRMSVFFPFYYFINTLFPCAPLPDGIVFTLEVISEVFFRTQFLSYVTLGVPCVHLLIKIGQLLCYNVHYIPYNVSLNMLRKKHRISFNSFTLSVWYSAYLLFICVHILNDKASIIILLNEFSVLDLLCLEIASSMIRINNLFLNIGRLIVTSIYISIYNNLLILWCYPFELIAYWVFNLIILLSLDVHPNPGQTPVNQAFSTGYLSFCNWNLNTLSKVNFHRVSILEAHNTIFKYDIISLCETSLNDENPVPENALPGYKYHPLNHPNGNRNGGVGIFYKESLPLRIRSDLSFDECLVTELIFGRKRIFFTAFYRNPEHKATSPEFDDFLTSFENLYAQIKNENPYENPFSLEM